MSGFQLQLRGGTTDEHSGFVGASREVTVDTTKNILVVHDGVTPGGHPIDRTVYNLVEDEIDKKVSNIQNNLDIIYSDISGSTISTTSVEGYTNSMEILGNTIQDAENLADIRSVGDKVEGQELYEIPVLSRGKNLFNGKLEQGTYAYDGSSKSPISGEIRNVNPIYVKGGSTICFTSNTSVGILVWEYNSLGVCELKSPSEVNMNVGFKLRENTKYINFRLGTSDENVVLQIEEGTVATPYEPYQEDKLTILSPTPLEKVGDVADRIIEKDGVWGAEKNVYNEVFTIDDISAVTFLDNVARYVFRPRTGLVLNRNAISNYTSNFYIDFAYDSESWYETGGTVVVKRNKATVGDTEEKAKEYLKNNPIVFLNTTTQPQFMPLLHDQQVKLRTFANKTNISFLTEIEGTIKAQVPKSLGATVNTHTEQINNLNKKLDRVKKLEESTVSTVTTESDFTTVEATSNGYFEDVKLEGKTLVNLGIEYYHKNVTSQNSIPSLVVAKTRCIKEINISGEFTIISNLEFWVSEIDSNGSVILNSNWCNPSSGYLYETSKNCSKAYFVFRKSDNSEFTSEEEFKALILEGDHTQNPPSGYIEGIKSVGDGADEIVISSVINKFKHPYLVENGKAYLYNNGSLITNAQYNTSHFLIDNGEQHFINFNLNDGIDIHITYWNDSTFISGVLVKQSVNLDVPNNCNKILLTYDTRITDILLYSQQDKKRLLFYNNETQTWEKPILREWDSIEKHSNGKYYYHQRSGEVVLNGSEDWNQPTWSKSEDWLSRNPNGFAYEVVISTLGKTTNTPIMCDKFNSESIPNSASLSIGYCALQEKYLSFATTAQSTIEQWKSELQTNPVTVVYQLAEEKVYECTNIDLITYANETNYIVESGAIVPRSTLKVHNNISNVVSLLQKKVSLLESKFIEGLKQVLAGDMYSLAELLYPEDFVNTTQVINDNSDKSTVVCCYSKE